MEKTLSSKLIYSGELINLFKEKVKLKKGKTAFREIVCHPGSVVGIILTLNKKIILIKQYRKAVKKFLWELPAGRIEKGENLKEALKREIFEETGIKCDKIKKITSFYSSPGFLNEKLTLFLAWEKERKLQKLEDDENIKIKEVALNEALNMIFHFKIKDAKTILGILILQASLKKFDKRVNL